MDLWIPPGRPLQAATLPRYCSVGPDDRVVLDLRGATFVDPFGLVAVASLVEGAKLDGSLLDLRLPADPSIRTYLARMHLGEALRNLGWTCDLEPVNERPVGDRLLELVNFSNDEGVEALGKAVHGIFIGEDPAEARELYDAVTEAAINVCDHSGRNGGWVALQQYKEGSSRKVCFAVADSGKGLKASLVARHSVPTDRRAIELAVERGVTSTDKPGRGLGLDTIVRRARARKGRVDLWSGQASAFTGPTEGSLYVHDHTHAFQGTIIYATLRF